MYNDVSAARVIQLKLWISDRQPRCSLRKVISLDRIRQCNISQLAATPCRKPARASDAVRGREEGDSDERHVAMCREDGAHDAKLGMASGWGGVM